MIANGLHNSFPKGGIPPSYKGGRIKDPRGYILVLSRDHPFPTKRGYVFEHRLVMENHLGRRLDLKEIIHHRNGIKDDNRIENLEIVTHAKPNGWVICPHCREPFQVH